MEFLGDEMAFDTRGILNKSAHIKEAVVFA